MRPIHLGFLLVLILLLGTEGLGNIKHPAPIHKGKALRSGVQYKTPQTSKYMPGRVIVKLRPGPLVKSRQSFGAVKLDRFAQQYGIEGIDEMFPNRPAAAKPSTVDLSRFYVLKYSKPMDPFAVAKELSLQADVEYAEPWFIYPVDAAPTFTPSDSEYIYQWALKRIKADSAWTVTQGDSTIIIGIDDSGVQWDHPDLYQNIWYNPGEMGLDAQGHDKRTNGIDDDGDGKIDDWHGWDFAGADYNNPTEDNEPSPTDVNNAHGTHVAGIAGASTNNVTGIAGVGFKCRILPLKAAADNDYRGAGGTGYIIAGFPALIYAADMHATVVNCSWGGTGYSQYEQDVINYVTAQGTLVVASAGNDGNITYNFPASYDNVICVASTNINDAKAGYSTFGPMVDVCAPGGDVLTLSRAILSTFYPSTYALEEGTSQAAPHVTGLAGLVKSVFPDYTAQQIGEQIRVTCDDNSAINSGYYQELGKGRINAYRAVTGSSPSIRVVGLVLNDSIGGNNDGVPQPNETINLVTTFADFLQPTSSAATVTLVSADAAVQVLHGSYLLGTVGTLAEKTISDSTFQIKIASGVSPDYIVNLTFNISDGSYSDFQTIGITVNPSYGTLNINNIKLTVTRQGRLGFNDFDLNTQGVGFVYGTGNELFEGGLMVGYSPVRLVDEVRNDQGLQDDDFTTAGVFSITTPGALADQEGVTSFTDAGSTPANTVGLAVNMHTYGFAAAPNQDFILLRYDLQNTSGADLTNLYAGLFLDWDILPPGNGAVAADYYTHNKTSYDSARGLGYAWYDSSLASVYCGAKPLTGTPGYFGLRNDSITGLRADKWSWMTSGIVPMRATTDISLSISSGPYTISDNATEVLGFALVGGTGLASLQAHADAAAAKWSDIFASILGLPRVAISVHQNPAFTRFADLYVSTDSALATVPTMTVTNNGGSTDTVLLTQLSPSVNIYKGPYQFASTGLKSIRVNAQTVGGYDTVVVRNFQVQLIAAGNAGSIADPTGNAVLQIPAGASGDDTYFLALAGDQPTGKVQKTSRVYTFSPVKPFTAPLALTISYADVPSWKGEERYIHLYRVDNGQMTEVPSWLDPAKGVVRATVTQLGDFVLGLDASSPARLLPTAFGLSQNYPNPFNPQTAIRFALPSGGLVRLTVYNLLGEEVRQLLNEERPAGEYEVRWDGTGSRGGALASGIYFYRIDVIQHDALTFSASKKMILMK